MLVQGRRLIEEEDEESYRRLRGRERNETPVHNYIAAYSKMTNHGDLIFAQRSIMINWIFQVYTLSAILFEKYTNICIVES